MLAEVKRQTIHMLLGSFIIAVLLLMEFKYAATFIFLFTALGLTLALLLKERKIKSKLLMEIIGALQRKNEVIIHGEPAIWFLLGVCITTLLFPDKIVLIVGLLVLTFGDAFSTIFGSAFGKIKLRENRTLEGSLAGIIAATLSLFYILGLPLHQAFIVAAIGMLAEYVPLNDNVTIPVFACFAFKLLM